MKQVFRTQTHMTTNARPTEQPNRRKEVNTMTKKIEVIPAPAIIFSTRTKTEKDIDDWYEAHEKKLKAQSANIDIELCAKCEALLRIHSKIQSSELCSECEQKFNAELELGTEVYDDIPPPPPILLADRS